MGQKVQNKCDDQKVPETLNNFFKSAVDALGIEENKVLLEITNKLRDPINIYSYKNILPPSLHSRYQRKYFFVHLEILICYQNGH